MRATTELFKDREKVIPPGEGVMGVTLSAEERRLRVELAAVEKERNRAQANWDKTRERLAQAEKERDEARAAFKFILEAAEEDK